MKNRFNNPALENFVEKHRPLGPEYDIYLASVSGNSIEINNEKKRDFSSFVYYQEEQKCLQDFEKLQFEKIVVL